MSRQRTLDEVRAEIDSIDDAIQDLLIRRTALVEEVRSIKRDWRVKIQPSREADIIYRLVERHHGSVSEARPGGDLAHPDLRDAVFRGAFLGCRLRRSGGRRHPGTSPATTSDPARR